MSDAKLREALERIYSFSKSPTVRRYAREAIRAQSESLPDSKMEMAALRERVQTMAGELLDASNSKRIASNKALGPILSAERYGEAMAYADAAQRIRRAVEG